MPPRNPAVNCSSNPPHCDDHSGLLMWMKGIAALLTAASAMLAFSVFWQAPNIRLEIAKDISRLEKADQDQVYRIQDMERDMRTLGQRVSKLER